jgi:acyl-CoA synthetase (AMP-forming)/AMP-acid ligase II
MPDDLNDTAVAILVSRLASFDSATAIDSEDRSVSFRELLAESDDWMDRLRDERVSSGTVCGYVGEYSPQTIALFVALMRLGAIAVPLTPSVEHELPRLAQIGGLERLVRFDAQGNATISHLSHHPPNPLLESFRATGNAGLIVFTSGSTGQPKAILHDLEKVLSKFAEPRQGRRTVLFLMMDHFGGVNTLLSTLAYGGVAVCISDRSPDAVCRAINRGRAELLPTTPTFLKMLIACGAWRDIDMSSVRLITYGTEPMPEATLVRLNEIFPGVELKQTYGLSELGVLHSKSPDPKSLWLKIGGRGFETRVVDGILHIRSNSSMVGYLNAASPIDAEGWMNTGDLVDEQEGLVRFRGRATEIINVGGQKVFPTEVESVLLQAGNIVDATVYGVKHPLLGQAIRARVSLASPEDESAVNERLKSHCLDRMAKFKVPLKFEVLPIEAQVTPRTKKQRYGVKTDITNAIKRQD